MCYIYQVFLEMENFSIYYQFRLINVFNKSTLMTFFKNFFVIDRSECFHLRIFFSFSVDLLFRHVSGKYVARWSVGC